MPGLEEIITQFLLSFGYLALFGIVFAESGLFFGFFLPGDSLLFIAGLLASRGFFNIYLVLIGVAFFAILGDQVGYWFGKKFGKRFFNKKDSFFRNPKHLIEAENFYKKHGKKAIVLARFIPVIRTFAPIVAGIANMEYKSFIAFNIFGGVLWTIVFVGLGFFLGKTIPDAGNYLSIIILAIIVLSLIPIILEVFKISKNLK